MLSKLNKEQTDIINEKMKKYEIECLKDYFKYYDKEIFLSVLGLIRMDLTSDYTIFVKRQGELMTDCEKEFGSNYFPFHNVKLTIEIYNSKDNNLNLFGEIFENEIKNLATFSTLYDRYNIEWENLKIDYEKSTKKDLG